VGYFAELMTINQRIEKRTAKYRVPVMEILMKMFFVLSFVPLVIAAAIAQQSATSGPGHPDPLPESSPVRIKQGSTPRSSDICIVHVTVIDTASGKENRDRSSPFREIV
jgi:hypothetical protein